MCDRRWWTARSGWSIGLALILMAGAVLARALPLLAQSAPAGAARGTGADSLATTSELRDLVDRYTADRLALSRRHPPEQSPAASFDRFERFYDEWRRALEATPFEPLSREGRIDYVLLRERLAYERSLLARQRTLRAAAAPLLPFANRIVALHDARARMESLDASRAAGVLSELAQEIARTRHAVDAGLAPGASGAPRDGAPAVPPISATKLDAFRAQATLDDLSATLRAWHGFYTGYDPLFTWWADAPYADASQALADYRTFLRERVLGIRAGDDDPIVGEPIGRDALVSDLASEWIPYAPEDLLAIAEREFAWCEAEARRAARELGVGDDWKAAVEQVKALHVAPGKQPDLIRDLALEAEDWIAKKDLITVPPLAREIWRIQMMTPERQKVNPFFTGGEVISVSFPTAGMAHEDKLMSMRGNNIHFARATVFHELIPGHHLQGFMTARYNSHRRAFSTPFWGEGWALYWEMLLWDLGFTTTATPEDRVGALFWRMHRAARIIFSLRFHLGEWTPQQGIDFLVDRVGHERANATAEVRRSFDGSYPPLYQLAYMMGGLQFRALHKELVESGKMSNRDFHDRILAGGPMPVELVRVRLLGQTITRDQQPRWRFAG